ncbi:hypothetical protein [Sphingobacterium sp. UT-1RO-CII-1]|uniref:hypothetical protein n=1 Tax=Sphingobacterium sp. UT-1RO-CII-1 TaxID=2995225 RepID=UPI00227D2CB4|nr:hypothetical protein [Sphingobacterium sp. UT-1RO-CII-1]
MTFEVFKTEAEKYEGASVGMNGNQVHLTYNSMWATFPVDRVDKMKEFLNNIKWRHSIDNPNKPTDENYDPTQPYPQLKLFD